MNEKTTQHFRETIMNDFVSGTDISKSNLEKRLDKEK